MRHAIPVLMLVTASCGGGSVANDLVLPSPREAEIPLAVRWTRNSAEHRAAFLQAYRLAGERVRMAAQGRPTGSWAVIMDADETILDNSQYQLERARVGLGFTSESWTEWVRRAAADTLPGAAPFIRLVRELGGRVAVVTNRKDFECEDTRDNLTNLGVEVDLVLCRTSAEPGDKGPRFRSVQDGTADPSIGPVDIVLWVGDNIQDFPELTQESALETGARLTDFGVRYVVLPNPMYGSWEGNPPD